MESMHFQSLFLPLPLTYPGLYLSFGDGTAPDRLQIAALAIGAAPYHLQMGMLATNARTGTTAEAPGSILTDRLSLAMPRGAEVARYLPKPINPWNFFAG
jgi:hypothetical protein